MTQIAWPRPTDPLTVRPPITFISEQHIDSATNPHVYASLTGLQVGDLMLLFTSGAFRVATPPTGWTLLGDAGSGGSAMTASVFAKFATSASESVSASFTSGNSANTSSIIVLRGPLRAWIRAVQTNNATQTSTPMAFADITPSVAGTGYVGTFPLGSAVKALVFLNTANAGATFSVVPVPEATHLAYTGIRSNYIYRTLPASSYVATPSGTIYQSGAVVHIN